VFVLIWLHTGTGKCENSHDKYAEASVGTETFVMENTASDHVGQPTV